MMVTSASPGGASFPSPHKLFHAAFAAFFPFSNIPLLSGASCGRAACTSSMRRLSAEMQAVMWWWS